MHIAITLAFTLAVAIRGHASSEPWDSVVQAVFRLNLFPDAWAGLCTAWAMEPVAGAGENEAYYVTAGHCRIATFVRDSGRFVHSPLLAASTTIRADVGLGIRPDRRNHKAFLQLDAAPPRAGDRILAAGFPDGMLMTAVMTVVGPGPEGLIVLRSSLPLRGGWSGAPLVSLATGRVIGVLADGVRDDPFIAVVVPAAGINRFLATVEPQVLGFQAASRPVARTLDR